MTQKLALALSAVITAFLLVVGGAVAARVSQPGVANAASAAAPAAASPDPTTDLQALLQQREAAYRQLIDQANQRLQQAYQQEQALADQANQAAASQPVVVSNQASAPAQQAAAAPTTYAVTPEGAINIAVGAAQGSTMIRTPELVLFEGKAAYEIGFTRGVLYVDANSGQVLYNGVTAPHAKSQTAPAQPSAGSSGNSDDHEHDDHSSHGNDD